jgi:PAS domain S-box-containing protein
MVGNSMERNLKHSSPDFKGIGFSKIGYFKEVRSKIKELEKLNIKLAMRHNRLEAIFNNMSDGVTILDRDMNIVFANQVQKEMFKGMNLIGCKCFNAYYDKNHICRNCPAQNTSKNCETLRGELLINSGKLSGRHMEWTTSPIRDPSGKVDEIILLMRDITERKEYEYKLFQADRMAAIGFLAAGIAHEINNPLTSIAGFSEGLLKRLTKFQGRIDPKLQQAFEQYLQIINDEAYRCRDIIANLQEFSRSSGDSFKAVKIDRVINDTISLFRQHAKDNNIRINFENTLIHGWNEVMGKESQLKHLFLNLFNRSFKSMEPGDSLKIIARNDENQIKIQVSGAARHITNANPDLILDSSCPESLATGIETVDLSICYNVVQHHRGNIQFHLEGDETGCLVMQFPAVFPEET